MYGSQSSSDSIHYTEKKLKLNKRNTIDEMIVTNQLKNQISPLMIELMGNRNDPNLIE